MASYPSNHYDAIFVGGGLSALMLLRAMADSAPRRIAIIEPRRFKPGLVSTVHWSYWSANPSFYDQFAIGRWRQARVGAGTAAGGRIQPAQDPQDLGNLTLRLVRSADVLTTLQQKIPKAERVGERAGSISLLPDGRYQVTVGSQKLTADWVFDSAVQLAPQFPATGPHATLSGGGLLVRASQPVFDKRTATLFDPLPSGGFAYVLPLSPSEALVESAHFSSSVRPPGEAPLTRYLSQQYPVASFAVSHREHGAIPLGFPAPASRTAGPRHILLGTKRGLVKPSGGYGIARIERESERLAKLWRQNKPLPPSRPLRQPWALIDRTFLQLVNERPEQALRLMQGSMRHLSLRDTLLFLDEQLPWHKLADLMRHSFPLVADFIWDDIARRIARRIAKKVQ